MYSDVLAHVCHVVVYILIKIPVLWQIFWKNICGDNVICMLCAIVELAMLSDIPANEDNLLYLFSSFFKYKLLKWITIFSFFCLYCPPFINFQVFSSVCQVGCFNLYYNTYFMLNVFIQVFQEEYSLNVEFHFWTCNAQ